MLYVSSYCSSFEVRSMKNNSNITDPSFIGSNIRYVLGLPQPRNKVWYVIDS